MPSILSGALRGLRRAAGALALAAVVPAGIALAQAGRVEGVVTDEGGKPIRGARVVAHNPDARPTSYETRTDDRGRWVVIGLAGGTWTFRASAPGFLPGTGAGRVGSVGSNPHFEFRLRRTHEPATAPSPVAPAAEVAAADALVAAGRLDEAMAAYRALLARSPGRPDLRLRLGRAQRVARSFDEAVATLRGIPAGAEEAAEAEQEIGLTLLDRGDLAGADEVLTRAAARPAAAREVFYALGEVKLARALPAEAATWFERAAATDPGWPRPLLKLGLVAANEGDRDRAVKYLRQVVALAPDSIEARQARTLLEQLR